VGRGGGEELLHRRHHAGIDEKRSPVILARMHGLESHGVDRDIARVDLRDGVAVVGDALEAAAGEHALGGHLQNLILQGSGAEIRDQNVHCTWYRPRMALALARARAW